MTGNAAPVSNHCSISEEVPPALTEQAVRRIHEAVEQSGKSFGVLSRIARQLGIGSGIASIVAW